MGKPTDIRVREADPSRERVAYRTPLKFGGVLSTHATVFTVRIRVETRDGRSAWGSGSMPFGNVWSFPSKRVAAADTARAMEVLADKIARRIVSFEEIAHPVELAHRWEPEWFRLADEGTRELALADPMPPLSALVVASAFDAAIHDAYGRVHGRHVYECYGPEWLEQDLAHYLDERFRGETLAPYSLTKPKPRLPLYHLVGALDALTGAEVQDRLNDGLPNTLGEWIVKDQLTHLKVKLNGNDAGWDVDRILAIDRVATETAPRAFTYSLDFNEQCPNVEYLLDVLRRVHERSAACFDRVAYVEQPTARDLKAHPENKMHAAAKLKPVVIDESLVDYESLLLSREQGYSGVALKSCKGQSQSLLLAAAAQKFGMFLCVQDLTCPGQSFLQSAGLAAHIGPVTAIEGNARQYCPAANAPWAAKHPGVFTIRGGHIDTSALSAVGLTA
ncbi:MAG TPA: enolase C-terminal domain-like protein [Planctomycetota bacterium]|nr:enolase C-terminal domain-like protein [Planctomycetota bacterium]